MRERSVLFRRSLLLIVAMPLGCAGGGAGTQSDGTLVSGANLQDNVDVGDPSSNLGADTPDVDSLASDDGLLCPPNVTCSRHVTPCSGASCPWSTSAPLSPLTIMQSSVVLGGKLYLFGGEPYHPVLCDYSQPPQPEPSSWFALTRVYNPSTNAWAPLAPMPIGTFGGAAYTFDEKAYVFSAYGPNAFDNALQIYDPSTDTWSPGSPFPRYRYVYMSGAVDGRVYLIGGQGELDDGPWKQNENWTYKDYVDIYDVASDSWSQGAAAPTAVAEGESCVIDDKIYVFTNIPSPVTYIYDVPSNSWSVGTASTLSRSDGVCVPHDGKAWVLGGRDPVGNIVDKVETYDPATDAWTDVFTMPVGRIWFTANDLGDSLYIVGGDSGLVDAQNTCMSVWVDIVDVLDWRLVNQ